VEGVLLLMIMMMMVDRRQEQLAMASYCVMGDPQLLTG
jgi:hypothetical protein